MKKVLIIEDNKLEMEALSCIIHKIEPKTELLTTNDMGEAVKLAISNSISLFIVDIVLNPKDKNDISGINFVETIRKLPQYRYSPVVFVTSLHDPRLYAYEKLHCYRYIQKPLFYKDVEKIFREALEFQVSVETETPLKIKQDGILYVIPKDDIIYAYSKAAKMTIVTEKERYDFYYLTCDELIELLSSNRFFKCNRSTIVNKNKVHSIDQRLDVIQFWSCDDKVKVGKTYKADVVRSLEE